LSDPNLDPSTNPEVVVDQVGRYEPSYRVGLADAIESLMHAGVDIELRLAVESSESALDRYVAPLSKNVALSWSYVNDTRCHTSTWSEALPTSSR
jgi:hypothetical protein